MMWEENHLAHVDLGRDTEDVKPRCGVSSFSSILVIAQCVHLIVKHNIGFSKINHSALQGSSFAVSVSLYSSELVIRR